MVIVFLDKRVALVVVLFGLVTLMGFSWIAVADEGSYKIIFQMPPLLDSDANNVAVIDENIIVFWESFNQSIQAFSYNVDNGFTQLWSRQLVENNFVSGYEEKELLKIMKTVMPDGEEKTVILAQALDTGGQECDDCIVVMDAYSGEELLRVPNPFDGSESLGAPIENVNRTGFWLLARDHNGVSRLIWVSWTPTDNSGDHNITYVLPKDISYRSNYAFAPNGTLIAIAYDDRPNAKYPKPRSIQVYDLTKTPPASITTIDVVASTSEEYVVGVDWLKSGNIAAFLNNYSIVLINPVTLEKRLVNTNLEDIIYHHGSKDYLSLVSGLSLGYHDSMGRLVFPLLANKSNPNIGVAEANVLLVFDENKISWDNDGRTGYYEFHPAALDSYNDLTIGDHTLGIGEGLIVLYEGGVIRVIEYRVSENNGDVYPVFNSNKLYLNTLTDNSFVKIIPNGSLLIGIDNVGKNPDYEENGAGYILGTLNTENREIGYLGNIAVITEKRKTGGFIPITVNVEWDPHIDSVAFSPDGSLMAVAGSLELKQDYYSAYGFTPDERGFVRVYDIVSKRILWRYDIPFPTGSSSDNQDYKNVFAPSLQFLSENELMVLYEHYDYGTGDIIYQLLVLELGDNGAVDIAYNGTIPVSFLPGGFDRAKGASAIADGNGNIHMIYSYEAVVNGDKHLIVNYTMIQPSRGGMTVNATLIDTTDIEWIFSVVPAITMDHGDSPSLYATVLASKQLTYTTWWGSQRWYLGYDSLLLKIEPGTGRLLAQVNLTSELYYPGTELPAGVVAGLEVFGEGLLAYIEATPIDIRMLMAHSPYNFLFLSKALQVTGNISMGSFINKTFEGGVMRRVWISNNPEFNVYAPFSMKFAVIDEGEKIVTIGISRDKLGYDILVLEKTKETQGPGGSVQPGGAGMAQSIKVHLTEEQRKLISEAREKVREASNRLRGILEKTGAAGIRENTSIIKEVFEQTNLTGIVQELVDEGLMDQPVRLPSQGRAALREVLESIYGPLLENYPEPMGRLYLLYTLYYQD